jgi:hypothetical protein
MKPTGDERDESKRSPEAQSPAGPVYAEYTAPPRDSVAGEYAEMRGELEAWDPDDVPLSEDPAYG